MRSAIVIMALSMGLILGGLPAFATDAFSAECENPAIMFPFSPDAQNIAVTYDRLQMCEDLLKTKDEIIAEQEKNTEILTKVNEKLNQAIDASEQANTALKQIIEVQKEQQRLKDQQCKEDIKKAKPGFFRDAGIFGLGGITGAIAMIVGLLLL